GSEQIDVDDRFESVRRHPKDGGRKIASRPANDDIDFAELIAGRFQGRRDALVVSNIGGMDRGGAAALANARSGRLELFLLSADEHDLGAVLCEPLGHPLPDPAASAGDESGLSGQNILPEN